MSVLTLLVDALLRLSRLVSHDDLALSKSQIFLHIGAFSLSACGSMLFWGSAIKFIIVPTVLNNLSWRIQYLFIIGELYVFGVFLSTVPLIFICNSLLNGGIAEK